MARSTENTAVAPVAYNDADFVLTIEGRKITVAPTYSAGYALSDVEAVVYDKALLDKAAKSCAANMKAAWKDLSEADLRAKATEYMNAYKPEKITPRTVADVRAEVAREVLAGILTTAGRAFDDASLDKTLPSFLTKAYDGSRPDWGTAVDTALDAEMAKVEKKAPKAASADASELALDDL